MTRLLVLLRHAKSARPDGVEDHERPLTPRGHRDADQAARVLAGLTPGPDLVLCSTALRAEQTWAHAGTGLARTPGVLRTPRLYEAGPGDVLALLRTVPATARCVVVVGHEPAMSGTALALAGAGSDPDALGRISRKFPTSGLAVLEPRVPWADLGPGTAAVLRFAVPRG